MQGGEGREVAEKVNGWVQDAVKTYDVIGVRAVMMTRLMHPDATPAEKHRLDLIANLMCDIELELQIINPRNIVVVTGI